jgi:hypothetical protein
VDTEPIGACCVGTRQPTSSVNRVGEAMTRTRAARYRKPPRNGSVLIAEGDAGSDCWGADIVSDCGQAAEQTRPLLFTLERCSG